MLAFLLLFWGFKITIFLFFRRLTRRHLSNFRNCKVVFSVLNLIIFFLYKFVKYFFEIIIEFKMFYIVGWIFEKTTDHIMAVGWRT